MEKQRLQLPLSEKLKSIPGVFGIHLSEQPKYTVLKKDGIYEMRDYEPILLAKTTVFGNYNLAAKEAFKRLANYIFGQNQGAKHMSMRSPVLRQGGVKLAMTSPVLQETSGFRDDHSVTMSFVLPSGLTLDSAPIPINPTIHLQEVPAQMWAVVSYSGRNTRGDIKERTQELQNWVNSMGLKIDYRSGQDALRVAQYDGPNTIPFLRLNEVQIRLWSEEFH